MPTINAPNQADRRRIAHTSLLLPRGESMLPRYIIVRTARSLAHDGIRRALFKEKLTAIS
jgi:hypothetical protein